MAPPVHEFSAISASRPRSTPGFHMLDHLQEQAYALSELKLSCKWYVPVVAHARLTEEERGIKAPPGFVRIFNNSAHVFRFFLDETGIKLFNQRSFEVSFISFRKSVYSLGSQSIFREFDDDIMRTIWKHWVEYMYQDGTR